MSGIHKNSNLEELEGDDGNQRQQKNSSEENSSAEETYGPTHSKHDQDIAGLGNLNGTCESSLGEISSGPQALARVELDPPRSPSENGAQACGFSPKAKRMKFNNEDSGAYQEKVELETVLERKNQRIAIDEQESDNSETLSATDSSIILTDGSMTISCDEDNFLHLSVRTMPPSAPPRRFTPHFSPLASTPPYWEILAQREEMERVIRTDSSQNTPSIDLVSVGSSEVTATEPTMDEEASVEELMRRIDGELERDLRIRDELIRLFQTSQASNRSSPEFTRTTQRCDNPMSMELCQRIQDWVNKHSGNDDEENE